MLNKLLGISPLTYTELPVLIKNGVIAQVLDYFKLCEQNNATRPEKRSKKSSAKPKLFSFKNAVDTDIYGLLYVPENYEPGNTYPTICYVYGGPDVQCVKNTQKLPR